MIDFGQFFGGEDNTGDLERRVVVLETVIKELLRRLAAAETSAQRTAQNLGRQRVQVGS